MDYTAQIQALKDASDQVDTLTAALATALSTYQSTERELAQAKIAMSAASDTLNAAMAVGGTVGTYSSIDTILQTERFAGKGAAVAFIQANPSCAQADAEAAWTTAALAATGLPVLIVPVANYFTLFSDNLLAEKLVPDTTWASFAAWIVATPAAVIMES
jgi:hypothetical protein